MYRRAAHEARWAHGYRPGIPVPSYPIDADWLDHLKGTMGNAGSSDVILGADESLWTHYDRHPQQPRPRKVRKCDEIESNDLQMPDGVVKPRRWHERATQWQREEEEDVIGVIDHNVDQASCAEQES